MEKVAKLVHRLFLAITDGVPLLLLSVLILKVWIDPMSIDAGGWVRLAASLVLIEFLLLHSGAFMAIGPVICSRWWQQLAWFVGFGAVYFISLMIYARWTGAAFAAWLVFGVLVSRLVTLVVLRDKKPIIMMLQRSAMGMLILVLTAVIVFVPFPHFGITEEVRFAAFGPAEDLLTQYPQRSMAWGALYFLIMGCVECRVGWWTPDWRDEDAEKAWEALQK